MRATVTAGVLLAAAALLVGCRAPESTESSARPPAVEPKAASPALVIGHGQEVEVKEHLVAGKTTIVDFYSEFCPACVMLAPELDKLIEKRPDLALVKVDVNRPDIKDQIDWESPVARQYKLESLPHLVVFDAEGKEVASGDQAMDRVMGWLERQE